MKLLLQYPMVIILTIIIAIIYLISALIIPGGIYLFDMMPSVMPSMVFPILFGLFFGPAGAIGCALGELITGLFSFDSSVTFYIEPYFSLFKATGNFFIAIASFKLWDLFECQGFGTKISFKSNDVVLRLSVIMVTGSIVYASFYSLGTTLLGSFGTLYGFIFAFLNCIGACIIIGVPLSILLLNFHILNFRFILLKDGVTDLSAKGRKRIREARSMSIILLAMVVLDAIATKFPISNPQKAIYEVNIVIFCLICIFIICFIFYCVSSSYCQGRRENTNSTVSFSADSRKGCTSAKHTNNVKNKSMPKRLN